jgi:hypothetical protein
MLDVAAEPGKDPVKVAKLLLEQPQVVAMATYSDRTRPETSAGERDERRARLKMVAWPV